MGCIPCFEAGAKQRKSRHASDADVMQARWDTLAKVAAPDQRRALAELEAGQKRGHWVWYAFPTLAARGGDMNSARTSGSPDLKDVEEARAYATHEQSRRMYLQILTTAATAFAKHERRGPYEVLDAGFRRAADGKWVRGPVDAFKARCSATLFAVIAHQAGDEELRQACVRLLEHFKGADMIYKAGGAGTAGYTEDAGATRNVLDGPDGPTLALLGASWDEVVAGRPR